MNNSDHPKHSPKISGMMSNDLPKSLSRAGWATIAIIAAALIAALLLLPSPYDSTQSLFSALIGQ